MCRSIAGVEHSDEAQHQHWPKRSQGGKTVVAVICSYCHQRIDNGPWGNAVEDGVYRIWDHRGTTLLRAVRVSSDGGEGLLSMDSGVSPIPPASVSARTSPPSPDAGPSPTLDGSRSSARTVAASPYTFHKNGLDLPEECTLEDAAKIADTLAGMREVHPWAVGDWVLQVEGRWPQTYSQVVDRLKLKPQTYGNYANVCEAFPRDQRVPLPFTYFQSCFKAPNRHEIIARALSEGLSRTEVRELAGHKPRISTLKFSVEELREKAAEWEAAYLDSGYAMHPDFLAFLETLDE